MKVQTRFNKFHKVGYVWSLVTQHEQVDMQIGYTDQEALEWCDSMQQLISNYRKLVRRNIKRSKKLH